VSDSDPNAPYIYDLISAVGDHINDGLGRLLPNQSGTPQQSCEAKGELSRKALEPKEVMTEAEAVNADVVKAACGLWDEQQIASAKVVETPSTIRAKPHPELGLVSIAIVYETRAEVFMLEPLSTSRISSDGRRAKSV
jgi:hypothetical protein